MKLERLTGRGNENLYRHPETGIIYFGLYRAGKGRLNPKSTRTKNLVEARRIADDFRMKFFGEIKIRRPRKLCGEIFPAWIVRKKIKARETTIQSIQFSWNHLSPYIKDLLPEEITAEWWECKYVPSKRAETHNQRRFFNDRKWLSMFLLSLKRDGLLEKTPVFVDVDPPRVAGKVYSDDEIGRLLANARGDLLLQLLMALTMGMRKSETLKLSWDRVDQENRTIHLRAEDTKIGKARTFGISDQVWEILKDRKTDGSPFVFPSFADPTRPLTNGGNQTAWENCKKKAQVTGRWHDLRHTFLTKAFKNSVNPALICHYAGLSLDEAERTYLHFTVEDTRAVAELVRVN